MSSCQTLDPKPSTCMPGSKNASSSHGSYSKTLTPNLQRVLKDDTIICGLCKLILSTSFESYGVSSELASKLLVCGNGGNHLGCPVSFRMSGRYRFGVSFVRVPRIVLQWFLTYLYSLNNPPYYCTITVILTPAHLNLLKLTPKLKTFTALCTLQLLH